MAWTLKVDEEDRIREEERKREKEQTARGMKTKGFDINLIIELTGLTKSEIEQL
jgi:hypothetical protein